MQLLETLHFDYHSPVVDAIFCWCSPIGFLYNILYVENISFYPIISSNKSSHVAFNQIYGIHRVLLPSNKFELWSPWTIDMSCLALLVIFSYARQLNYFPIKKPIKCFVQFPWYPLAKTPQPCEPGNSSFWPSTSMSIPASWNTSSTPGTPRRWWRNAFATDPGALRGGAAARRLKPWNMETLPDFGFETPEKNGGKVELTRWILSNPKYCD